MNGICTVEAPLEERLRPGTDLHRKVIRRLTDRLRYAKDHIEKRYSSWDDTRANTGLYLSLNEAAKLGDGSVDTSTAEMPFDRSLRIPMSLAIQMTLLSQVMGIYWSRDPVFQLRGAAPEDIRTAPLMESVLAYDMHRTGLYHVLYSLFQDALSFGNGFLYDSWLVEMGYKQEYIRVPGVPHDVLQMVLGPLADRPYETWGVRDEGVRWRTLDPYQVYPDPRSGASDVQKGEFIFHRYRPSVLALRSAPDGVYFNLDYLRRYDGSDTFDTDRGTASTIDQDVDTFYSSEESSSERARQKHDGFIQAVSGQIRLIPREWGLADRDRPELWVFSWAEKSAVDDGTIIRAHRCAAPHQTFSYSIAQVLPDMHSQFSPGMIESVGSMQRFIDWLFNSRYSSVASQLNPSYLYAPDFVMRDDLENRGIGDGVRITPEGVDAMLDGRITNISQFLHQMNIVDVTQPHQQVVDYLYSQAQTMTGANDPTMGVPSGSGTTATEVSALTANASARIVMMVQLIDSMAIKPAVERAIANRQALTQAEQYYRIVGDQAQAAGGSHAWLRAQDIQGSYDYIPTTGSSPQDPARSAATLTNMMMTAASIPQLQQPGPDGRMIDYRAMLSAAAEKAGIRGFERFLTAAAPPQVMEDEALQQQVQAGNMIPAGAVM